MEGTSEYNIYTGVRKSGKSAAMLKFAELNERNLFVPPNRAEDTFDFAPEINVYSILDTISQGRFYDFDLFFASKHKDILPLHRAFTMAISEELRFKKGNRRIYIEHPEIFSIISSRAPFNSKIPKIPIGFSHGGVFFDDFKDYIGSNNPPDNVRKLIRSGRHYWLDLFFACHGPSDIPPVFLNWEPKIYIFRTSGQFNTDGRFTRLPELEEIQKRVNHITNPHRPGYKPEDQYYCEIFK